MAQTSSRGVKLFCWLFMVVGFVALGAGGWTLIKSLRTTNWPVTEGVITATHIASHSGEHGSKIKGYARAVPSPWGERANAKASSGSPGENRRGGNFHSDASRLNLRIMFAIYSFLK